MTPNDAGSLPSDEHLLGRLLACDALLHGAADPGGDPSAPPPSTDDERARDRLMLLLRMLDAAEETAGAPADRGNGPGAKSGPLLGRFDVLEDLGAGGFGFVVRARDRLLGREVALKMPLPERLLGPGGLARSLREARAAARLDHPGIVRVFDAGEIGPLGYFIASEFCRGPALRRWLREQSGPVPARLAARWAAGLADAVQHAHDRGILHRDIKPDNVILAQAPESGGFLPRLTDFGLAKLVEEAGDETRSDARPGTPAYMAPEQAAGRRHEVGPAADVYALGATLYETLTGRPPFGGDSEAETLRLVLEAEPVPPRSLRPGLPRDLETICLKCLRKEPARRYATAAELRDDLLRFLEGRPIVGRPVSPADRAWGWARRRPGVAALVGLVIVLAGALIGGLARWITWLERHQQELERYVARAERNAEEARKQSRLAEDRRRLAERLHHAEGLRRTRQALDARQVELAQDILRDLRPMPDEADPRGFAWRYLWRQAHREFSQLWGNEATIMGWAAPPDARALAAWDLHGKVVIWDVAPGLTLDRPRAASPATGRNLSVLRFSPDGRHLAGIEAGIRPAIRLIDAATGSPIARLEVGPPAANPDLRFDAEGHRLATLVDAPDGTAAVWWWDLARLEAGPHRRPISKGLSYSLLSEDARWVAITGTRGVVLLDPWSGAVRRELATPAIAPPWWPQFSADGSHVAAIAGHQILLWETGTGREVGRYEFDGVIGRYLLSPRGRRLAVMDDSGRVAIHDRTTGRRSVLAPAEPRRVRNHGLAFSPDETRLAVAIAAVSGGMQPAEVWDVTTSRRLGTFPGRTDPASASFFPGDRSLIVGGGSGPRIWRLDPPGEPESIAGHAAEAWAAAFSPNGRVLATGSDDTREPRTIRLWDRATGRALASWTGHTATVSALAFSPDGRLLASGSLDMGRPGHPNVILWDAATHRRLAALEGHTDRVRSVAFSPDGKWLATAGDDGTARLWDVTGRTTRGVLSGHAQRVTSVAFSPDGKTLATASNDATARLWDVATLSTRAILREMGEVHAVAFAPDGSLLASANLEGGIRLWDPATGEVVQTIRGEAEPLRCLAFSPTGRNLAAAGMGKVVRIWDTATGQELLALDGHKDQINALAFAPDGQTLASCSHDGAVRLWQAGPIETVPSR